MVDLLLISPTPTHPTNAGNRARIRTLLELLEKSAVDFHFVFFRQEPADEAAMVKRWGAARCTFLDFSFPPRQYTLPQRIRARIDRLMTGKAYIPYRIDDWCGQQLVDDVQKVADRIKPKCAQIEYVFFSRLFKCFGPEVFKILDTHDVVANRHKMFLAQGREPEWFYTTRQQEGVGINRADCVMAIQPEEKTHYEKLTNKPVITVGHMVPLVAPDPPLTASPTAIFMGSGNSVNQDALAYLLDEIWPRIVKAVPDANLEIYGPICSHIKNPAPNVQPMGNTEEISDAYKRAWVVLCPLRMGTGLKIKSIEALGYSKALVSTASGSTGLEDGLGTAYWRGDSADDFAGSCINLLRDSTARTKLENSAYAYAGHWNDRQTKAFAKVLQLAHLA